MRVFILLFKYIYYYKTLTTLGFLYKPGLPSFNDLEENIRPFRIFSVKKRHAPPETRIVNHELIACGLCVGALSCRNEIPLTLLSTFIIRCSVTSSNGSIIIHGNPTKLKQALFHQIFQHVISYALENQSATFHKFLICYCVK